MDQEAMEFKLNQKRAELREAEMRTDIERERLAQLRATRTNAEDRRILELREADLAKERVEMEAKRLAMEKEVADRVNVLERQIQQPTQQPATTTAAVPAAQNRLIRGDASFSELEEEIWKNAIIY